MSLSLSCHLVPCPGPAAFGNLRSSLVVCPSICLSLWDWLPHRGLSPTMQLPIWDLLHLVAHCSHLSNCDILVWDWLLSGPCLEPLREPAAFHIYHNSLWIYYFLSVYQVWLQHCKVDSKEPKGRETRNSCTPLNLYCSGFFFFFFCLWRRLHRPFFCHYLN